MITPDHGCTPTPPPSSNPASISESNLQPTEQPIEIVRFPDSDLATHPAIVAVDTVLQSAGLVNRIHVLNTHARTAALAAAALHVNVEQIANSLIFAMPKQPEQPAQPLLIMASGGHKVNIQRLAETLGLAKIQRADAAFVRENSGFAIGGVAPVAHQVTPRIVIDESLAEHPELWAAAGHPRSIFSLTFDELVDITQGQVLAVA